MEIVEFEQLFGNFNEVSDDFRPMLWCTSTEYFLYCPEAKIKKQKKETIS